jgi:hypothetical protein
MSNTATERRNEMSHRAVNEKRSIAALMLLLSGAFVSYFAVALATPVVPVSIQNALTAPPLCFF